MTEVFALLSVQPCCFFTCAGDAAVDQEAGGCCHAAHCRGGASLPNLPHAVVFAFIAALRSELAQT